MNAMKSKSTAAVAASRNTSYSNPTTHATSASSRLDHKFSTTSSAATSGLTSIMSHNTNTFTGMSSLTGVLSSTARTEPSTVTWAPTPEQKTSEIDKIMAKIEQARLSIANVCVLIWYRESFVLYIASYYSLTKKKQQTNYNHSRKIH